MTETPDLGDLLLAAIKHPSKDTVGSAMRGLVGIFDRDNPGKTPSKITSLVLDTTGKMKPSSRSELRAQHPGLSDRQIADELVRVAAKKSMLIGAASGAVASAGSLAPPAWVTLPLGPVASTILTSLLELHLVAELHSLYGAPLPTGNAERAKVLVTSWLSGKGAKSLSDVTSWKDAAKDSLTKNLKRRLMMRLARSISSVAPLFVGAVINGGLSRSGTKTLGDSIVKSLARG